MAESDTPNGSFFERHGRLLGGVLLIIGVGGIVLGIWKEFSAVRVPFGSPDWFAKASTMTFQGFLIIVAGMAFTFFGSLTLIYALLPHYTRYIARKTAPAVSTITESAAKGVAKGLGQVVRVRCKKCGHLEREDAKFCSNCGEPL